MHLEFSILYRHLIFIFVFYTADRFSLDSYYRKERSKRPHQSKRPGALKIAKTALIYDTLLKNTPGTLQTPRGILFRACSKGPTTEAERDASQHAVDGIAWVFFFSFIYQIKFFFLLFVSRPLDSTRPDQYFFLSGNAPGGAFCPIFVLKNAPGTLQTPPGRYFGIV